MKKIIALLLSLAMLIGCAGCAETTALTVDASCMNQQILSGTLTIGTDNDGCSTVSVDYNALGNAVSAILQASPESITISADGAVYTVTAEALTQVLTSLISAYVSADMVGYLTGDESMQDLMTLAGVAMNEANRVAVIASQLGIVTMTEAGDLVIECDADTLIKLAAQYLSEVSADAQIISMLTSTALWAKLGLPDADTAAMYASAIAAQLSSVTAEQFGVSGTVKLTLTADGTMGFAMNLANAQDSLTVEAAYGNGEYAVNFCGTKNGETISVTYVISLADLYVYEAVSTPAMKHTSDAHVEDNKLYMSVAKTLDYSKMPGIVMLDDEYIVDLTAEYVIDLVTYGFSYNGSIKDYDCTMIGAVQETTETGLTYRIMINAAGEEATLDFIIEGTEVTVVAYQDEIEFVRVIYGIRMEDAGTMVLYSIDDYSEDDLYITIDSNNLALRLIVNSIYGDTQYTTEVATASVSVYTTDETAAHISGYELSVEEIMQVIGMLAAAF